MLRELAVLGKHSLDWLTEEEISASHAFTTEIHASFEALFRRVEVRHLVDENLVAAVAVHLVERNTLSHVHRELATFRLFLQDRLEQRVVD